MGFHRLDLNPTAKGRPARLGRWRALPVLVLSLLLVTLGGCDGADSRHLFSLDGTGSVEGMAFLDLNRDGGASSGEGPLAGVQVRLIMSGSRDTVASMTTGEDGMFEAEDLVVGSYEVTAGGALLGDSLVLTGVDPERVQVAPNGTAGVTVGISFPLNTFGEAAAQAPGRRLYVEGRVLNTRGSLPDEAVHVWDGERALRVTGVGDGNFNVGDTVRMLGRTAREAGRTILTEGQAFRIGVSDGSLQPVFLSTQSARSAQGGGLDGALVQVTEASVTDVRAVEGGVVATATDGSGPVSIRIPNDHLGQAGIPVLQPGAVLSVRGILLPGPEANRWELRTRSGNDLLIEAQGGISGQAFYDRNGSGNFDAGDSPLPGVRVSLFRTDDLQTPVDEAQSDQQGRFVFSPLDVNSYVLEVDETTIPDSLEVRSINPGTINVPTGGTAEVSVVVSHPQVTSAEARELPEGRTVFLQGIALNARTALGDNSVHIRDDAGALRTLEVDGTVRAGDRLRVRGRTTVVNGQMTLTAVTPFVQSTGGVPGAAIVTSRQAAIADGGTRDADAVLVREATITDASGTQMRWVVRVDDGSGGVDVVIRLASVGLTAEEAAERFVVGENLDVSGVLVPEEDTSVWRIHPRTGGDLTFLE